MSVELIVGKRYRWTHCDNTTDWCCGNEGEFLGAPFNSPTFLVAEDGSGYEGHDGWHPNDPPNHIEEVKS